MLTQGQTSLVWERMIEAEVRALYFADLATRYTKRKQIITGSSFFLSSGAAATLGAQAPHWIPLLMAIVVAILMAYSIALNLDKRAGTMAKLHYTWNHLNADYEHLWYHWYDNEAEQVLEELMKRGREASETASTEAPFDERLIENWQDRVYARYEKRAA